MWPNVLIPSTAYTGCGGMFIHLVSSMNLGKQGLKMSQTKVSCNSQLYSGHQTIYVWRLSRISSVEFKLYTVTKAKSHKFRLQTVMRVGHMGLHSQDN